MSTIAERAKEVRAASAAELPADVTAAFRSAQKALAASGVPAGAVKVGDQMAPFSLPDATGAQRTLDELTSEGPAVIVFYRGGWCPYCNLALRTYQRELLPELGAFSARLVAISPETPDASLDTQEKAELAFSVLSDAGATLAATLGITFTPTEDNLAAQRSVGLDIRDARDDHGTVLPMPTVVIVDQQRRVRYVDIHPDYSERTEVGDILAALPDATG